MTPNILCKNFEFSEDHCSHYPVYRVRTFRVRSFEMIQKRITDPRSLGSRCIKGTNESTLGKDFSVPSMHHDPSDLGSVILFRIIPRVHTQEIAH